MNFLDFNNPQFIISLILSVLNGLLMCFASYKLLQILQLSNYKLLGYRAWLKDTKGKHLSRLLMLSFLSISCMLVVNALLKNYSVYYSYIGLVFYIWFATIFILNINKAPKKTPLVQTHRLSRIVFVLFILSIICSIIFIGVSTVYVPLLGYGSLALVPIILPVLVPLAHFITVPLESIIGKYYINKSKKELAKMKDLIKIGITGSYGKTSTKYILNKMLAKKYSVCMSPLSFNTPMGTTKAILKYLKPENEVFIAEMGAKQTGEIKELCDIVQPQYGIITSIGLQHLNTFGSLENIKKTKNELAQYISEQNFVAYQGDNENTLELYEKRKGNKLIVSSSNNKADCYIKNIEINKLGSTFDLVINKNEIQCQTKLLGIHNIQNIALCAIVASKLGVSNVKIKKAISELEPVPHRMELKKYSKYTVIDNSYNSSVDGVVASLNTLKLFEGRKIMITPGLIDLQNKEQSENISFGKQLASVADIVIIVNQVNKDSIKTGLLENGFDENNIYYIDRLGEVFSLFKRILQKNDVIWFENDLPDNYL